MSPEKHDDFLRSTPREHKDHDINPPTKYDELFKNEGTQKPFDRFYYGPLIKNLEAEIKKGENPFFDYIEKNPFPMPEDLLKIIKEKDSDMYSDLSNLLIQRPNALEDLGDIIFILNNPPDFRTVGYTLERLKKFLSQD